MGNVRFDQITQAPSMDSLSYVVGTHDNGDGTFTDYRYTPAQMVAFALQSTRQKINVTTGAISNSNMTFQNSFFATTLTGWAVNGSYYINGVDFSQDTTAQTITYTNGSTFANGQTGVAIL